MARIRTIHPRFPRSASMCRVTRDARLLFIQLWLVADDAGRLPLNLAILAEELYPSDHDALASLPSWLDQLEREGCVEHYSIEGRDYLRIVKWRKHQTIDRPTPSTLPGAPREYGERREDSPPSRKIRALPGDPREDAEKTDGEGVVLSEELVLRRLDNIYRAADKKGSYQSALRSTELMGKKLNMWASKPKPKAKAAAAIPSSGPSLAVLHGRAQLDSE